MKDGYTSDQIVTRLNEIQAGITKAERLESASPESQDRALWAVGSMIGAYYSSCLGFTTISGGPKRQQECAEALVAIAYSLAVFATLIPEQLGMIARRFPENLRHPVTPSLLRTSDADESELMLHAGGLAKAVRESRPDWMADYVGYLLNSCYRLAAQTCGVTLWKLLEDQWQEQADNVFLAVSGEQSPTLPGMDAVKRDCSSCGKTITEREWDNCPMPGCPQFASMPVSTKKG